MIELMKNFSIKQEEKMKQFKTTAVIFLALIIFTSYANAWLAFNGGGKPFICDNNTCEIDQLIFEGGGHFLNSYSDFVSFLGKIELSGKPVVNEELKAVFSSAITNLEKARKSYLDLVNAADAVPYDTDYLNNLIGFDYNGLQQEKELNPLVFFEIKDFLGEGDVRGAFKTFSNDINALYMQMTELKTSVDNNQLSMPGLRQKNHEYLKLVQFAQYAAEVFDHI